MKSRRKTRQANGKARMHVRQRMERDAARARENFDTLTDGQRQRMADADDAVHFQAGLSAKVTQAIYRAWVALKSPGPYAAALAYVADKLAQLVERTREVVDGLMKAWAKMMRERVPA